MTAGLLHLKVDIDRDMAAQLTLAAMAHGTSVAAEVNAALTEWLARPAAEPESDVEAESEATILRLVRRGA